MLTPKPLYRTPHRWHRFPRKHGPVNSGESMTANARRTSQRVIHFAAPSFSAEIPSFAAQFVHPAHDSVNGWQ
jgi:hypothetical protein